MAMTKKQLKVAIEEAKRFQEKAKAALKHLEELDSENDFTGYASKHTGAARRASLDLTRVLADLRRSV